MVRNLVYSLALVGVVLVSDACQRSTTKFSVLWEATSTPAPTSSTSQSVSAPIEPASTSIASTSVSASSSAVVADAALSEDFGACKNTYPNVGATWVEELSVEATMAETCGWLVAENALCPACVVDHELTKARSMHLRMQKEIVAANQGNITRLRAALSADTRIDSVPQWLGWTGPKTWDSLSSPAVLSATLGYDFRQDSDERAIWLLDSFGAPHANEMESIAACGQSIATYSAMVVSSASSIELPAVHVSMDPKSTDGLRTGRMDIAVKGHSNWGPRSWAEILHLKGTLQVRATDWTLLDFELEGTLERHFRSCFDNPCSTFSCRPESLKIHWRRPCLRPSK